MKIDNFKQKFNNLNRIKRTKKTIKRKTCFEKANYNIGRSI